ncbi:hypothetical protein VN97_g12897 [Penicillium thymicola]|uniref:Uncharacterized protein n=1 Tax=Penicillium thymicola TaxID=293382 RepID=A0AAI9T667_PENTH|nr:hypothetical protein VN97_g12897 [Penicillium thymicola]
MSETTRTLSNISLLLSLSSQSTPHITNLPALFLHLNHIKWICPMWGHVPQTPMHPTIIIIAPKLFSRIVSITRYREFYYLRLSKCG